MAEASITDLLDRNVELAQIEAALESARAGAGGALIVEGVAGIGKTSLLSYARQRAAQAGMMVLVARAAEFEEGYAWGVVRQLFDRLVRSGLAESELLSGAAGLAVPALGAKSELIGVDEDAFAVLHGLYWLTANLAGQGPLLLAVDDLHWSDRPSLRFVAHLARRLEGLPVLLMATTRPPRSAASADALLPAVVAEPGVLVVRPAALGSTACSAVIHSALAGDPSPGFEEACREVTGGNPFLLYALIDTVAAEGLRGGDGDVAHVRRLTPRAVSQSVLLRLGRMSSAALSVARAVAVLGTGATLVRIATLAELHPPSVADAIEALTAERVLDDEPEVGFVHPLVRSAVYEDLSVSTRQRWHERAARSLADEGAKLDEVTWHLLASGTSGDQWLVDTLRRAASEARRRGAPDLARSYLERALLEPPVAASRAEVLLELGRVEVDQMPAAAVEHLTEALQMGVGSVQRSSIELTLSQALALVGRFRDAVEVLETGIVELDDPRSAHGITLRTALLNVGRWDLTTRPLTRPLITELLHEATENENTDPRVHANLAIELCAEGRDRAGALHHARQALKAVPELMSTQTQALPEVISVLVFADLYDEASDAIGSWLQPAQRRGWRHSTAMTATIASLLACRRGDISDAIAWARQGLDAGADTWLMPIATGFLVLALIERGDLELARTELEQRGLAAELMPTWPYNVARHARGCLSLAAGDHAGAWTDLTTAGDLAERWGIHNPAMMRWRSPAGLAIAADGGHREAQQLCTEELDGARSWGSAAAVGVALRSAGDVQGGTRRIDLLTDAVRVLEPTPARLELARALIHLGVALRHRGARTQARQQLRAGLHLAHQHGGLALAEQAYNELVIAGGRPRRLALRGRDALTPSELRVAQLAQQGQTNRQIAQTLFVTQRTVEIHLTNAYNKLGITSRQDLTTSLENTES
jgi:DNA-binding CsgD family transcriptional regulator